jgi:hypothetical protein
MSSPFEAVSVRKSYLYLSEVPLRAIADLWGVEHVFQGAQLAKLLFVECPNVARLVTTQGGAIVAGVSFGSTKTPTMFLNVTVTTLSIRGLPSDERGNVALSIPLSLAKLIAQSFLNAAIGG